MEQQSRSFQRAKTNFDIHLNNAIAKRNYGQTEVYETQSIESYDDLLFGERLIREIDRKYLRREKQEQWAASVISR
jgi:hypothetical protein